MKTILGCILFLAPFLICTLTTKLYFGPDWGDIFRRWKYGRKLGLLLLVTYIYFIVSLGHNEISGKNDYWFESYIIPGVAVSLVVYSNGLVDMFEYYTSIRAYEWAEDYVYLFGWVIVFGVSVDFGVEWIISK